MKRRALAVLFVAGLASGCTDADWDHALSYAGLGSQRNVSDTAPAQPQAPAATSAPTETQASAPAPAPAADNWCAEVAKAAQDEAAGQGFDVPTQQRRAQSAFQQCTRGGQS